MEFEPITCIHEFILNDDTTNNIIAANKDFLCRWFSISYYYSIYEF